MTGTPEGMTHHTFEFDFGGRKIVRELDVPFSEAELVTLEQLKTIYNGWGKEATRGSSLIRELYAQLIDIPWGTALKDRELAIEDIRKTVGNIRVVRERHSGNDDYLSVASELSLIESGLLQFVPDMEIKK